MLAALILPEDLVDKLRAQLSTSGFEQPTVQVIVNEEDPVKARLVDDRIDALINEANLKVSASSRTRCVQYLDLSLNGGTFNFLGQSVKILGLAQTQKIIADVATTLPKSDPNRAKLEQIVKFSSMAQQNFGVADDLLGSFASRSRSTSRSSPARRPSSTTSRSRSRRRSR